VNSLLLALSLAGAAADSATLYRVLLLRAAPGRLLEVIDLYKQHLPAYDALRELRPFIMRHSQGDQWDLLLLFPMTADRVQASDAAWFGAAVAPRVAWQEEVFVAGPPRDRVAAALGTGDFYHIEMHLALAGKQADLVREREMENAFERWLGRPEDLIFTRVAGASWDVISIGTFRDIRHYAESADIPPARQDSAARAAGFTSADAIGPYLRTVIASHHDTLARAVR
jgi:hypothetical protein